jgi:3-deoxy-D-manno-octulosonic-acid transferase
MNRFLNFCCRFPYNIVVVPFLQLMSFCATAFSMKARKRWQGERQTWRTLAALPRNQRNLWFHAASLGEFEQLIPIIERVNRLQPSVGIVVSFFSPSGYEPRCSYALADAVVYLPLDSKRNARRFVNFVQPVCAVVARYDAWWNMLEAVRAYGSDAILVSATLNEANLLLRTAFGRAYVRMVYGLFTTMYTAGESETVKFGRLDIKPDSDFPTIITAADTRFDRIAEQVQAAQSQPNEVIPNGFFAGEDFVLVLGSSWEADETAVFAGISLMEEPLQKRLRLVVVPHEPAPAAVQRLLTTLPQSEVLGVLQEKQWSSTPKHIIVDSIGNLLRLYGFANAAYIGGGFGSGVHSVAEAAGYGLPLACAPRVDRARDAEALYTLGALRIIRTAQDVCTWLTELMQSPETCRAQGALAYEYVHRNRGWSDTITKRLADSMITESIPNPS